MNTAFKDLIRTLAPQKMAIFGDALADAVSTSVALSLLEEVPDDKLVELDRIIESGSAEALAHFLHEHVPSLETRIHEALERLQADAQILLS